MPMNGKEIPEEKETLDEREARLQERLHHVEELEAEVRRREQELKKQEKAKKQVLLRLAPGLWKEIAAMAEADFRSINGEIEFLLTEAVRRYRGRQ